MLQSKYLGIFTGTIWDCSSRNCVLKQNVKLESSKRQSLISIYTKLLHVITQENGGFVQVSQLRLVSGPYPGYYHTLLALYTTAQGAVTYGDTIAILKLI